MMVILQKKFHRPDFIQKQASPKCSEWSVEFCCVCNSKILSL